MRKLLLALDSLPRDASTAPGARLSDAAGATGRGLSCRPDARHRRAADRSIAHGASRAASHRRQPAGRWQQYWHRGSRARAGRWLYAPRAYFCQRGQCNTLQWAEFRSAGDIAPVVGTFRSPAVLVVAPSLPAKTVPELIAYAKANPGKLNYASAGYGTLNNVAGEMFKTMAGVDLIHVPYRGSYMPDLLSGQVQVTFAPIATVIEYIKAGKSVPSRQPARRAPMRCPTCPP